MKVAFKENKFIWRITSIISPKHLRRFDLNGCNCIWHLVGPVTCTRFSFQRLFEELTKPSQTLYWNGTESKLLLCYLQTVRGRSSRRLCLECFSKIKLCEQSPLWINLCPDTVYCCHVPGYNEKCFFACHLVWLYMSTAGSAKERGNCTEYIVLHLLRKCRYKKVQGWQQDREFILSTW